MHQGLTALLALYLLSLVSSIAGMEFFSTLIVLAVGALGIRSAISPQRSQLNLVALGSDWALWAFWGVVTTGALTIPSLPDGYALTVIGEARWIVPLYAFSALLYFKREEQSRYLLWLAALASIVAAYSLIQVFTGLDIFRSHPYVSDNFGDITVWRAKGFFHNTMTYSYSIGILICFLLSAVVIFYFKNKQQRIALASLTLLGLAFFLTFTRGAWLALFAASSTMLLLQNWRRGVKFILVASVFIVGLAIINPAVRSRLTSISTEASGTTTNNQRWELWRSNWEMFKDHPWLGVGYGQNSLYTEEYNLKTTGRRGFVADAHSNYLQVLAGSGIFGFLLWMYFCGYFFYIAVRLWISHRGKGSWAEVVALGSIGAQIFFHIGGLTQATFFDGEPMHMFIFFWAMLVSQKENFKNARR